LARRDPDVIVGRVVTFPDFIPSGQEHLHPGMGNGGKGCDFLPEGKNCFDEWVSEPVAIAPPRRGPGRPRKDKYSRKPVAANVAPPLCEYRVERRDNLADAVASETVSAGEVMVTGWEFEPDEVETILVAEE